MKKQKVALILLSLTLTLTLFIFQGICLSDTFTNLQTKEQIHGYITKHVENGQATVHTQEKGIINLNLGEWQVTRDKLGRNNNVIVLPVENPIFYEIETAAFEKAIDICADEGPLLILIEIDTPGGRVDLAQRMCAAIGRTTNCDVIAFIKGGKYGGAISAGAAVSLACNKIYMAENTIIGAATLVTNPNAKMSDKDKERSYAEVVDEKMSSIWRAYLASLAQQNNRPGLLARAMVDSSIEVIEVNEMTNRLFIEPVNKRPDQQVVRTWNKAGSLVTLTAQEAVGCTIADGLANSQRELLLKLQAQDANVIYDKNIANAKREIDIVLRKVEDIRKSLDLKIKQFKYPQPSGKAIGILRGARSDFEILKGLAQKYPDLHINVSDIEDELNSINAAYENAVRETRSRK